MMMIKPTVSVIVPTYNRLEKLKKAIGSVLSQTFKDFEIIVVDDGSSDGTKEYFDSTKQDVRVKYFYKENEGSPAISRNFGASFAKGQFLAFLDSDDEWLPFKLERQVSLLKNEVDVVFTYSQAITSRNLCVSGYFPKKSGDIRVPLLLRNFIVTSSVVVKKEFFVKSDGFPVELGLTIAEDLKLWLKLSALGKGIYIDEVLVKYDFIDGISNNVVKKFDCLYSVTRWGIEKFSMSPLMGEIIMLNFWIRRYLQCRKVPMLLEDFRMKFKELSSNYLLNVFLALTS